MWYPKPVALLLIYIYFFFDSVVRRRKKRLVREGREEKQKTVIKSVQMDNVCLLKRVRSLLRMYF